MSYRRASLIAVFLFLQGNALAVADTVDRVVAIVEDKVITQTEVDEVASTVLAKLKRQGVPYQNDKIRQRVLEELIMRHLRDAEAERLNIKVTEADLKRAMEMVEKQNKLPPGTLPQALQREGIGLPEYKKQLSDQILETRIMNKVIRQQVTVTDEEIESLKKGSQGLSKSFDEVRLAQIILQMDPRASNEEQQKVQKKATEIYSRLQAGESFASLASQYSEDSSALNGGDIGWFKSGQLLPEVETILGQMQNGQYTKPIRSQLGIHFFLLLDRRASSQESTPVMGSDSSLGEVRVRHILIKTDSNAPPEKEIVAKLRDIKARVANGEDFARLAKEYSQDSTAANGGELGWLAAGMTVPAFEKVAFSLNKNEVSDPVQSEFGWHLILVEEKRASSSKVVNKERARIEARVRDGKMRARYQQWLRDLRMNAFVEFK